MVRLVTQYNNVNGFGNPFDIGRGWDGANGPWVYHIISYDYTGSSIAPDVGLKGHSDITTSEWVGEHLNKFRLELVYE